MTETITENPPEKKRMGRPPKNRNVEPPVKEDPYKDLARFDFTAEDLARELGNPMWRLNHLYKIIDKRRQIITFKLNPAQEMLVQNLHTRNVILKARKMGFSTFIQLFQLDTALFSPNERCVVIAQDLLTAESIFRDVIKFAYDNLPEVFRSAASTESEPSKSKIEFSNGSIIEVRTSSRGLSPSVLHISEFGKIAAKDPGKAREIITGAITSVPEDGLIFVESTAEAGEEGEFYNMVKTAKRLEETGKQLWKLEFKFHFYGWHMDSAYVAPPSVAVISPREHEYFDTIESQTGKIITPEQRAWYIQTLMNTYSGEQQMMYQEFPSTWEEAFKQSMEGAYFTEQFRLLRKQDRITDVTYDPAYPVCAFFDLGASDQTAVWCIQSKPSGFHCINYLEASGEPFNYFVKALQDFGYLYDTIYLPHDASQRRQQGYIVTTAEEMFRELAPMWNFYLVPKTPDKMLAIQQGRDFILNCVFDQTNCKLGISRLEAYRKEFDTRTQMYRSTPRHGPESNGADAFLQAAQARAGGAFGGISNIASGSADMFGSGGFYQPADLGY